MVNKSYNYDRAHTFYTYEYTGLNGPTYYNCITGSRYYKPILEATDGRIYTFDRTNKKLLIYLKDTYDI